MDATSVNATLEPQVSFEILDDVVLPESKRGKVGAPKYPFDRLEPGKTFFVPQSPQFPDPMKTLTSAVAAAKMRYAVKVGVETKTRAKRGVRNKLILDDHGERIMITKEVPIYEFERKFTLRPVEAGQMCGRWKAPVDGVLVQRVK